MASLRRIRMIIVLKPEATESQIKHIVEKVKALGLKPMISKGVERTIIGLIGEEDVLRSTPLDVFPGVEKVMSILAPYKLVSREFKHDNSVINAGKIKIGGKKIAVMAGPCSVENREMLIRIARDVKKAGASILRGGAFKPRTSPYSFQGLGEEGLKYLALARKKTGLPVVTEVMDTREVELVAKYADMLQIGARNMANFNLLKEVGKTNKAILLKRGPGSTIQELLMSAEYIMSEGNKNVVLCERGIKTFETATRNTLDLNAVPVIKKLSHLPVVVDPSHGTGEWDYVPAMALASV